MKGEREREREKECKRGRQREKRYLYLTRREQRKEVQSCSRQELQKRGRRAMGLWQGRPGRERRDARGERAGMVEGERSKREKIKHVFKKYQL